MHLPLNVVNIYLMKHIIFGLLFFVVWLFISSYWYVCGVRKMCEQVKPKQEVLLPQEIVKTPDKISEPAPVVAEIPKPAVMPEVKIEEKKEYIIPVIYFMPDMDSVKNVEELIEAYRTVLMSIKDNDKNKLYITGHTSADEAQDDYILGLQRAESIKEYMTERGIPDSKIITFSKGDSEPKGSNDIQEGKLFNRRVEMIIK